MKKAWYGAEQVALALRQAESGTPVPEVCRKMGIAELTFLLPVEEEVCQYGSPFAAFCHEPRLHHYFWSGLDYYGGHSLH